MARTRTYRLRPSTSRQACPPARPTHAGHALQHRPIREDADAMPIRPASKNAARQQALPARTWLPEPAAASEAFHRMKTSELRESTPIRPPRHSGNIIKPPHGA